MTRAPWRSAISTEPSVEPLSATMTSPMRPPFRNAFTALSMQKARELASFRQGITTEIPTGCGTPTASGDVPSEVRVVFIQNFLFDSENGKHCTPKSPAPTLLRRFFIRSSVPFTPADADNNLFVEQNLAITWDAIERNPGPQGEKEVRAVSDTLPPRKADRNAGFWKGD